MNTDQELNRNQQRKQSDDARSLFPPLASVKKNPRSSVFIRGSSSRVLIGAGISFALAATGLLLFFFDPAQNAFYPGCVFHKLTGLSCPGCGGLRASHRLLHGEVVEAFRLNPLLIILMPVFAWWTLREVVRLASGKILPAILPWKKCGWILLGIVIVFTVIRNLPWPQFSWMAAS